MKLNIHPPMVAGFYLLIALGIDRYLIEARVIHPPYHYLGFIIVAMAIILVIWAVLAFRRNSTTLDHHDIPVALVTTGPFRFGRNPMYVGLTIGLIGMAIIIGTLALFFVPLAFLLTMNWAFVPREEKNLEQVFGEAYLNYKERVRRWL